MFELADDYDPHRWEVVMLLARVTMQLDTLRCISQADFDETGTILSGSTSEPYLWVAVFFSDNSQLSGNPDLATTFNLLEGSSCRQLLPEGVQAGTVIPIPLQIGKVQLTMDLVGFSPVAGVVAVVLEENETSDELIRIGHQTFGAALRDEIRDVVKSGKKELTDEEKRAIESRIEDRVKTAIREHAGIGEFFRLKDRFIGSMTETFTGPVLQLLLDKAPGLPYPIQDRVRKERTIRLGDFPPFKVVDEYEISGSVSVSHFVPPAPDPCQGETDALAAANAEIETIDADLLELQQKLRFSPPAKQKEIRAEIKAQQARRRIVAHQRDEAFASLQQCRAQHPGFSGISKGPSE